MFVTVLLNPHCEVYVCPTWVRLYTCSCGIGHGYDELRRGIRARSGSSY